MALRPREERILRQIEESLRTCDPKLSGMLSIFTKLAAHEEIPAETGQPVKAAWNRGILRVAAATIIAGALLLPLLAVRGTSGSLPKSHVTCSGATTWMPLAPATRCPATSSPQPDQLPQAGP